ncbi:MAG: hypothetical protein DI539_04520 [Flavobacterium psychrophilum]|nr:MAG: hypothetical protein DI539_04520 [Flavobacterium psychrophilum]
MKKILLSACMLFGIAASAQVVNIPDPVFKNWLLSSNASNSGIALDANNNPIIIDANGDNEIQVSEAEQVWWLSIGDAGITDATGLEAFVNVRIFMCHGNPDLTSLDMTPLVNLERFYCDDGTGLESLTFEGLSNLNYVFIMGTDLDTINMTGVTALETFTLQDVPVTNIDFSDAVSLINVGLYGTNLQDVSFENSPLLNEVGLIGNELLESVNVKNGDNFFQFEIEDNPQLSFMCIDEGEDGILLPYFTSQNVTPPAMSTDCTSVAGKEEFMNDNSLAVYPNPSNGIVNVSASGVIKQLELYDIQGRLLQTKATNETNVSFDLTGRAAGIYLLKVATDNGSKVQKLIKK